MKHELYILLATYNGATYLRAQLDSLLEQTYSDWKLFIGDDMSTDSTIEIVEEYMKRDSRISLVKNTSNSGVIRNFENLLLSADADYYMFCDQDDVWVNTKIEESLNAMMKIESEKTKDEPIYVFTDLMKVDQGLKPMDKKYNINMPYDITFNRILLRNVIPGCVSMINNSLKDKILPFPEGIMFHDYWMAMIASAIGTLEFIPRKLIYYRHHGKNVTAQERRQPKERFITAVKKKLSRRKIKAFMTKEKRQVRIFYLRFKDQLKPDKLNIIQEFLVMEESSFFKRKFIQFRYGFYRNTFYDNFELFFRL